MDEEPDYRREYEGLKEEFSLASALLEARSRAGLTQDSAVERARFIHGFAAIIRKPARGPAQTPARP